MTFKDVTFQAAGMQQMYYAVRKTGAANIVIASGNNWGNTVPNGYLLTGTNIVYGVHAYTCPTVAPPDCTNTSPYDPQQILGAWVGISHNVPVIVSEFGWPDPHSVQHDGLQQRRSGEPLLGSGDHVANRNAVLEAAEDLLAAG